ncbi:MAG: AAA family ATPase [Pseudomonadota bacterium]
MSVTRILITGCSGAGKSTLVAGMAERGYEVRREPGRRVIRAETRMGGTGLPWQDEERFARLCLKMAAADWEEARVGKVVFDRGVLDAALALERAGFEAEAEAALQTYRYDVVILAAPWPDLFDRDEERRQGLIDAQAEFDHIAHRLPELGYRPLDLPQGTLVARVDWLEGVIRDA